jgi:hypothetical protein
MIPATRGDLRELLRRVDEVRGLAERSETPTTLDPDDRAALGRTVAERGKSSSAAIAG